MAAGADGPSEAGVQRFDRVRRAEHLTDLDVIGNGRNPEAALEKLRNAPPKIEPAPAPEPVTTEAEAAVPAAQDPVALLKGLAELHAAGVLTDDEFAVQKEKLLGQI